MKIVTKTNFFLLFTSFIMGLWFISYLIISPSYEKIEKDKNFTNIKTIIFNMDNEAKYIKNIIEDYAKWDDTYNFIKTRNNDYIYENFREGTGTLEGLKLDFIIFSNKNDKTIFSKYQDMLNKINITEFENMVMKVFKESKTSNIFINFQNKTFFLVQSEINKSDSSSKSNGYIYSGKLITNDYITSISKVFGKSELGKSYKFVNHEKNITSDYFNNVKYFTQLKEHKIFTTINFYSNNNLIFSIDTVNNSDIINEGLSITFKYNLSIISLFFLLLLIIYKNQKDLERFNTKLEKEVRFRTNDLNKNMKLVKEKNKELDLLANTDPLTKIKNRRSFFISCTELLNKAVKDNKNFSVILIDIDYFKKVNDRYGHAVGDVVLKELCRIINEDLNANDIFGRLGGEEFCIGIFYKTDREVHDFAEKLRNKCEKNTLRIDKKHIKFTISMGISSTRSSNHTQIDSLLQEADINLYKAKNSGRNKVIGELTTP